MSYQLNGVVRVNWRKTFDPSYVRHIIGIRKHGESSGSVEIDDYLPDILLEQDCLYKDGDLFIVSQNINTEFKDSNSNRIPCLYYLVQISKESPFGYFVVKAVRESDSYPYSENKLVSKILHDLKLLKQVIIV